MPVYEYRCRNCDHGFEIQQAMSEDALVTCPKCGEPQLRKVFQPVGISFKGSGFYKNDTRSSSKSTSSSSSATSSGSSAGPTSDSSKVESTSAAGTSASTD